jgi:histidinol-phosphate phosphatase family protein
MNLRDFSFDKSWTLFLDRDGVINERIIDGYVTRWEEFKFLPGVLEAIERFTGIFGRIVIVSNQQGIGKGLMTEDDLDKIHERMLEDIRTAGGEISAIYFSPYLASTNHITRKPNTGMAFLAAEDFPDIDFTKSVMIGDTINDMLFGKQMQMLTIITSEEDFDSELVDFQFRSLSEIAKTINS